MISNLIITHALIEPSVNLETFSAFTSSVEKHQKDVSVQFCSIQELVFVLKDQKPEIYFGQKPLKDIADVLYLRNVEKFTDYANAVRLYADANKIKVINYEDVRLPYYGKVSQGFLYALLDLSTPEFASSPRNETLAAWLAAESYGFPFILKDGNGIKGRRNYLVRDEKQLHHILSQESHNYVVQPYIENNGELRILTFGLGRHHLIFKKQAVDGSHLNNTSQGGDASRVADDDVSQDIHEAVDCILRATKRENIGIDVLIGTDGKWYVLEANTTPALYTGAFPDMKASEYADMLVAIHANIVEHS